MTPLPPCPLRWLAQVFCHSTGRLSHKLHTGSWGLGGGKACPEQSRVAHRVSGTSQAPSPTAGASAHRPHSQCALGAPVHYTVTHICRVVFPGNVDQVSESLVQVASRRVRVTPCQQPCIGDVAMNREVPWGPGFHCEKNDIWVRACPHSRGDTTQYTGHGPPRLFRDNAHLCRTLVGHHTDSEPQRMWSQSW
jgi:hypothetical protein